jgi:hypothetical protein
MNKLLCIFLLGILSSCGNQTAGGGKGSVETTNGIDLCLIDDQGAPIARMWVRVAPAWSMGDSIIYDSLQSDSAGVLHWRGKWEGLLAVEGIHESGKTIWETILASDVDSLASKTLDTIGLSNPIQVTLSTEESGVLIGYTGSKFSVRASAEGAVMQFPRPGEYVLWARNSSGQVLQWMGHVEQGKLMHIPSFPASESIVLDDFDGECGVSTLHNLMGGGYWFGLGNETLVVPNPDPTITSEHCVEDSLWSHGKSFHLSYQASGQDTIGNWVLVGIVFGREGVPVNLSGLETISFWAKGKGSVSVQLNTEKVRLFGDYGYHQKDISLDSQWTQIRIGAEELLAPQGSQASMQGVMIGDVLRQSHLVQFVVHGSGEIWLDDLTLEGVLGEDLAKSKQ